jgi:hypothetical protein
VSIQCSTPLPFSPPLSFLLFILALYSWYNTEDEAIDWLRNEMPDIIFVMYRLVAVLVFMHNSLSPPCRKLAETLSRRLNVLYIHR